MIKKCSKCKETKPYSDFYEKKRKEIYGSSHAGISWWCKECIKKKQVKYRVNNPEKAKSIDLRQSFGIDIEYYNNIFKLQKGQCAICCKHQSELSKSLAVDHDHDAGHVRGLLCNNCNAGLGFFRDSMDLLLEAAEYLRPIPGLRNNPELAGNNTNVVDLDSTKGRG